ncbi:hypothetical protein GCM10027048_40030 [Hymenobacter coalescens]
MALLLPLSRTAAAQSTPGSAGSAFSCDGTFYIIRQVSNANGTTGLDRSQLFRVNRNVVPAADPTTTQYTNTLVYDLGTGANVGATTDFVVNALAYNPRDGYLYALTYPVGNTGFPTVNLYKIGQGGVENLGTITLGGAAPAGNYPQFAAGVIDKDGFYYVAPRNLADASYRSSLFRFDLNQATNAAKRNATVIPMQFYVSTAPTTAVTPANTTDFSFIDLGINPADNALYGVYGLGTIYKFDFATTPGTARVTRTGPVPDGTVNLGSASFDVSGNFYAYSNEGNFYSINIATGASTDIGDVPTAAVTDGASCINPEQRLDVVKEVTAVTPINATTYNVSFAIRVKNTGTVTTTNVQVSDFLRGSATNSTFPTSSSVTIVGTPTITNNGGALVLNSAFTGQGANADLLSGNQPLTAGQSAVINFTVQVVFPTGSVPTTAQNNTAYASSVAGTTANPGYSLQGSGTLVVPPGDLLAVDASTNSGTLPTTANGDVASPTPVFLTAAILGNIFEDYNYGGGAGRARLASQGLAVEAGARVELYSNGATPALARLIAVATTDADGSYRFVSGQNGVPTLSGGGQYIVRVVNSTVASQRLNAGVTASTVVPVQTFVSNGQTDDTERVGGENNTLAEAANAGTTGNGSTTGTLLTSLTTLAATPLSITTVTLPSSGPRLGVDFGFNYSTIINTNDTGRGSLRQFITNANGLSNTGLAQVGQPAGQETSIFMLYDGVDVAGYTAPRLGLTDLINADGVAVFTPASILPALTDANTAIDGTTQTTNMGNTNTGTLGAGGTTGTAGTALGVVNQPEIQIVGTSTRAIGIDVTSTATQTLIEGIAIYGFGNVTNANTNANIRVAANNTTITGNVIGGSATVFSTALTTNSDNIRITAGTGVQVSNNLIGFANGYGVRVNSGATATITGNEINTNGRGTNLDGVSILASGVTVSNNRISGHDGNGIETAVGGDGVIVSGNTISGNGLGTGATSGIRLAADNATISSNVITANYGAGIRGLNGADNNTFSQNSIYDNGNVTNNANAGASGQIGIDLLSSGETSATNQNNGVAPYVTLNDIGDADNGANGLLNMPVITQATVRNGNLLIAGFAKPGAVLEFFTAKSNPTSANATAANFGQGETYLFSRTEGAANDLLATTGSYSGNINGFNQGAENGQNRFSFSIPVASLTAAQQTAISNGTLVLTATATISGEGTSEFSGKAPVLLAPVATNDFALTTPGTPVTLPVTANDLNNIDAATVNLATQGIGNSYTVAGQGTFTWASNGQIVFTPVAGFTGIVTIPYTVNNPSGVTSNTAFISVEVKAPTMDLATTFLAPANNSTAGASQTYSLRSSNNSGTAVSGIVQTLQLPVGLTTGGGTVAVTGGAYSNNTTFYDNETGLVTIPVGTLGAGASTPYDVIVSNMPGSGPVTATANITGTGIETNPANNVATLTLNIAARYDVATTITGPATAVTRGNEVTYTVTTTNLSTTTGSVSPAPNVVQKVSLPAGLSGVFASNGGTYDSSTGVVTFPAIGALPLGQTVVNTISFAAPGVDYIIPTATVTAGASNDNAGDLNGPNNSATLNGLTFGSAVTTVAGTAAVNVYTTITASATNVAPGAAVTLNVVAANAGFNPATSVVETLQLPAGLTRGGTQTVSVTNGSYNDATGLVTFNALGTLQAGATSTSIGTPLSVTFNAPQQGFVLATATVYTASADQLPADNLVQTKVEVNPLTDLVTTLAGPATAATGQAVVYTVTTSNTGDAPATGVVQRVSLPAGLTGVQVSNGGTYDSNTGIVTFTIGGTLVKGAVQTNSITYTVPTGATSFTAAASVSSNVPETVLTNNTAAVATTVLASTDVTVAVTSPATAPVGTPVTFAVSTRNNGPATATSVVPTLQLPAGLTSVAITSGGNYDAVTGLVTFGTATLPSGNAVTNTVTVVMPDVASLNGVARVTAAGVETNYDNNVASTAITPSNAPTTTAELSTTIISSASTVDPNASTIVAASYTNNGPSAATNVVPSIALPAGLTAFGTVTVSNSGSYNPATGVVTWPVVANLAVGATLPTTSYSVTFTSPTSGSILATSYVASANLDGTMSNNVASTTVNVATKADVATGISGPASTQPGASVTYAVTTLNNGPSPTSSTQTVTIPAGATNISYSGPTGPVSVTNGTTLITFPAISNQAVGAAGEVTNYVTFAAPSTGYTVTANVTPANVYGDVTGNNAASTNTVINRAPVAFNVVNSLQTPEANTAGRLLISPLVATDADNNTLTYAITSLPNATQQGTLYLGTTAITALSQVQALSAGQISTLRFDPVTGYVGNVFFSYTATDNATTPLTSNTAIYTIAVGQDVNSQYTAAPTRGGTLANAYQNGDLITSVYDVNSGRYTNNGTATTVADNGVRSATTDVAGTNTLTGLGLTLDPTTGAITVQNRTLLRAGNYSLNVTTIDANGGTNTQLVNFTIGFGPLPVTLVEFGVKARNSDAVLNWKTAMEKDNDHFDVERSTDGLTFVKVGEVKGHGTTNVAQQYGYTDANAARLGTQVYYRLKQVDLDGTATVTDARAVSFDKPTQVELTLFPNPATEVLNVRLAGEKALSATVTVYSATGSLVQQVQLGSSLSTQLDVRALPAGTYLVKVQAAGGLPLTRRFVKN